MRTTRLYLALATLPLLTGCYTQAEFAAYRQERIRQGEVYAYGHTIPDLPPLDTSHMTFEQRMQALAVLNAMRGPQAPVTTTTCRPFAGTLTCDSF